LFFHDESSVDLEVNLQKKKVLRIISTVKTFFNTFIETKIKSEHEKF